MNTLIDNFELIVNNKGKLREAAIEEIRRFTRTYGKEAISFGGCEFRFPDNIVFYVSPEYIIKSEAKETFGWALRFKSTDISNAELHCYPHPYEDSTSAYGLDIFKEFSNEGILNLLKFLKRIENGLK